MKKICNLNILIKKRCVEQTQVLGFLTSVTLESYKTNSDADGVYFSKTKKLIKQTEKLNFCGYPTSCDKSKFIMTHQRISTSGYEPDYHQPFKCDEQEFVLEHNGIINQFKEETGSDTYGFFYNHFLKEFKEGRGSREKRIIKAIKKTLCDCLGSYSIALYDVKKETMYYFRNDNKIISFFKSDDDKILYITTRNLNKDYLHFFHRKFEEMNIKSRNIYKITVGKKIITKKVGRIPETPKKRLKKYSYSPNYTRNNGYDNRRGCYMGSGYYDKTKKKPRLENIFESTKEISENNRVKLTLMFNEHFIKDGYGSGTIDDIVLDEMLSCGYSLRDFGFNICSAGEVCGVCYQEAFFTDEIGSPICTDCVIKKQLDVNSDFDMADDYMTRGGDYEHF